MASESPARVAFDQLSTYAAVGALIDDGEAEGQYLECKAPRSPRLDRSQRSDLAQAVSGFGNSGGGIIIWGVSTTRHEHSGLDVLSQREPIGNVRRFAQQVDAAVPALAVPVIQVPPTRVILAGRTADRGIAVTYIPPSAGDPVQTTTDRHFWIRSGAEFVHAPYDVVRRMFAGAEAPDLVPLFDPRLCSLEPDGSWTIAFVIGNFSSAAASQCTISVTVLNPDAVNSVVPSDGFQDVGSINPGQTMFSATLNAPIYRSLNVVVGRLNVSMARGRRPRRVLRLAINVYADRMRARRWDETIHLSQAGFSTRRSERTFLY
jgi:Schlafen, AlbA_2